MVVVKSGTLTYPGKHYKVYMNQDSSHKWYLRVTHTFADGTRNNKHFRAGTYATQEQALEAVKSLDPICPKKGREKRGTVDHYANGQWRVRIKHRGEHMHVGYFRDKKKAYERLEQVLSNEEYLNERYQSLMQKRQRKRELNKQREKLGIQGNAPWYLVKQEEDEESGFRASKRRKCLTAQESLLAFQMRQAAKQQQPPMKQLEYIAFNSLESSYGRVSSPVNPPSLMKTEFQNNTEGQMNFASFRPKVEQCTQYSPILYKSRKVYPPPTSPQLIEWCDLIINGQKLAQTSPTSQQPTKLLKSPLTTPIDYVDE